MERAKNVLGVSEQVYEREVAQPKALTLINELAISRLILVFAMAAGVFLRIWQIDAMGFNTDEAVYAGQAAAIARVSGLSNIFPIFRAHPLLFQFILSLVYRVHFSDLLGRLLAVAISLGTVFLVYEIGKTLHSRLVGALAALFLALMPYHVIVSRQVLLDGPMTFFATLTIYMLARYGSTQKAVWLYAAGGAMGLTFLSKETSIIMIGSIFVFIALSPEVRTRLRDLVIAIVTMALVIAPFPISLILAGSGSTGKNYLVWQLFRRPNHPWSFYLTTVPPEIGILVIVTALAGLYLLRREHTWREKLLLAWIIVPLVFFEIWPVKGYQYLLPIAPAFVLLAGRALGRLIIKAQRNRLLSPVKRIANLPILYWLVVLATVASLGLSSWQRIQPETSAQFLAGTGGVPGGREAGLWIQKNVPIQARFMTIGPSMANIIEFYGARLAYGLAVSPNPLHRNPSYDPINNPDLQIRNSELQYLVWDSFSASRSTFFSDKLMAYVTKYNGRAIHTETITVKDKNGNPVVKPVIIIYEVYP
jgi:4-amino-4-deoxy-L-arabinose transferase-like glycosyltransferase